MTPGSHRWLLVSGRPGASRPRSAPPRRLVVFAFRRHVAAASAFFAFGAAEVVVTFVVVLPGAAELGGEPPKPPKHAWPLGCGRREAFEKDSRPADLFSLPPLSGHSSRYAHRRRHKSRPHRRAAQSTATNKGVIGAGGKRRPHRDRGGGRGERGRKEEESHCRRRATPASCSFGV